MYMQQGKTAKAFTRSKFICTKNINKTFSKLSETDPTSSLGLPQFFLGKMPWCVVTLYTRKLQTPAVLHPLKRNHHRVQRNNSTGAQQNCTASDFNACEHLSPP